MVVEMMMVVVMMMVVGYWSNWNTCSETCGGGEKTRSYTIITNANEGGEACPHQDGYTETLECNTASCPDISEDCEGSWGQWSSCSRECGPGYETRTYNITKEKVNDGNDCPNDNGEEEERVCNLGSCHSGRRGDLEADGCYGVACMR